MLVSKTIQVPKEANDVVEALKKVMTSTKKAVADGFQPLADVPAIVTDSWKELAEAVKGFDQLDDEAKANQKEMIVLAGCGVGEVLGELLAKPSA